MNGRPPFPMPPYGGVPPPMGFPGAPPQMGFGTLMMLMQLLEAQLCC